MSSSGGIRSSIEDGLGASVVCSRGSVAVNSQAGDFLNVGGGTINFIDAEGDNFGSGFGTISLGDAAGDFVQLLSGAYQVFVGGVMEEEITTAHVAVQPGVLLEDEGGLNNAAGVAFSNPGLVSGSAAQMSATKSGLYTFNVTTGGTVTLTAGPTSTGLGHTYINARTFVAGDCCGGYLIPAGWFAKIVLVTAVIADQQFVTL